MIVVSNRACPARSSRTRSIVQAVLLASAGMSCTVLAATPAVAQSARSYDIAAGTLANALNDFAEQSGIELVYDSGIVAGRASKGLGGSFDPAAALSRLLVGTGLTFRQTTPRTYTIEPAPQAANGAIQLGPVRVEGEGGSGRGSPLRDDPTMTENSGSYTSQAMSTATKMPLSIRETPQSVTVITSQVIEDKQIDDLVDIVEHTTGLSINRYESNRGSLFARGFKIESYLIDGVPTTINEQWSAGEILSNMAMLDHVEVLRGSDGLMVGAGNPSAIINMVRKRANSDVLTASIAVEGGSWSHFGATADISAPLTASGKTRIRLVADFDRSDSYIDRLANRSYTLYGTLEQDIGERTLVSAGISYQDNHTDSPTWGGIPVWTVDSGNKVIPLNLDRSFNPSPDWAYWDAEYINAFARIEHDFGGGWRARASYTRGERDSESKIALYYSRPIDPDTGQSFLPFGSIKFPMPGNAGIYNVLNDKDDVNLQLNGKVRLLGGTHDVIFGYDWSGERSIDDGAPGLVTAAITPNIFQFDPNMPEPDYISPANRFNNNKVTQEAFFAATRISLAKPLKLIAGARLINYHVTDYKAPENSFKSGDEIIPYVGLVLDLFRDLSVYASYTSIFQPQKNLDADGAMLAPIEGNTYEAGIKGAFFDGRLNAALSVYRMEQRNVAQYAGQVPLDPAFPNGPKRQSYEAIDGIVSKGFEAEVNGEILPDWNVTAGYSQFKARQPSGTEVSPLIPRKQFNLFTSYRLRGPLDGLTVGGGVRWQSETSAYQAFATALGVPELKQESYLVADLMARYRIADNWSVQLNIKNLFDKAYFAPTDDVMQMFWQEPRSAQLRVKYQF